ncbi:MAG TPA: PepSY-associated TM helix domain-containing protein [Bryobacteraceae bacterium]|nr:PepSY-associated TM helix domain-containing protein [Bryobacteraceae bacterium]
MRKVLFWMHLTAGVTVGTVVLIMSVTGVALMYEKQMMRWADVRALPTQPQGTAPMPVEDIIARVRAQRGGLPSSITWRNGPAEPVLMSYGRENVAYVDGATGIILGEGSKGTRDFFHTMTDWHRYLGREGEGRATGKAITGGCNLAFLFMVLSGLYLWFPREWTKRHFGSILLFRGGLGGRARDFNWHNVIGFWCLVPLFFIVISGSVISYPWASNLVYTLTGSEAPPLQAKGGESKKDGAKRGKKGEGRPAAPPGLLAPPPADLPLDGINAAFERARSARSHWESITLRLPPSERGPIVFTVDEGGPGRADLRSTVTLRRDTGEVKVTSDYDTFNTGRKARTWLRFAHTGEVYGIAGQTIAGVASLGAVFLFYTGVALSLRRFAAWRKRRDRLPQVEEAVA